MLKGEIFYVMDGVDDDGYSNTTVYLFPKIVDFLKDGEIPIEKKRQVLDNYPILKIYI
jgi:hypothetical protein